MNFIRLIVITLLVKFIRLKLNSSGSNYQALIKFTGMAHRYEALVTFIRL